MFTNLKKTYILALSIIIVVYFLSRFLSIANFPIFTDEAIYIRWAQIAKNDAAWRFISLTDGKQPLYIWLAIIVMKIVKEPLIAGRIVSVFSGLGSIIGLFVLGKLLLKRWGIGLIAAFLYVISPYAYVYDRIALMDGTLTALMIWTFIFSVLLVKTLRLDIALILGGLIGFASLTKTSGFIALYLLPAFLILLTGNKTEFKKSLTKFLSLTFVILLVSQMFYSVLRLSPYFHIIAQKDKTFIYGFSEWLKHPLLNLLGNYRGLLDWALTYLTIFWVISVLLSFFWRKELIREKLLLISWFFVPLSGLALFGRVIYPRFIFFMTVPLFLLVAYFFIKILDLKKIWLSLTLFIILIFKPILIDYSLITEPVKAQIPISDLHQYYTDWPSGWGIKEAVLFFEKESKNGPLIVYTEGTFGMMPASLEIYLGNNKNISIIGVWPIPDSPSKEILLNAQKKPSYILFFQNEPPPSWPLLLISKIRKGASERFQTVYQIIPK